MNSQPGQHAPASARRAQPLVLLATRQTGGGNEELPDDLVDVLLEEAAKRGWRLLDLTLTEGSVSGEQADPVGALVTLLPTDDLSQVLRGLGCPAVRLGRLPHPDDRIMPAVLPDYREAGRMAADYLAQRSFVDLALVGHAEAGMKQQVEAGLRERAEALGCKCHLLEFRNIPLPAVTSKAKADRYDDRTRRLGQWLETLPKPVGLIACTPAIAGMVNIMCQRVGLAVPEDVAVLSLGNQRKVCELGPVPLSAVEISYQDRIRRAAELLTELIAGKAVADQTFVPPRAVITRRSTDILAVSDPTVARAIRFIWDHLDTSLKVDDVASAVRVPRYKLERLFRKHLDRGVSQEIRRARLERFARLLRTTDHTVDELAPMVGYRSSKRLHNVFKDTFAVTPRRYRLSARIEATADEPTAG